MSAFAKGSHRLALLLLKVAIAVSVIGAVWLGFHKEWTLLIGATAAMFLGGFAIFVVTLPDFIFSIPATMMNVRGNKKGFWFFSFLSDLYEVIVRCVWCLGVIFVFQHYAPPELIVPAMMVAWATATVPIAWIEMDDTVEDGRDVEYSMASTFFVLIATGVAALVVALGFPVLYTAVQFFVLLIIPAIILEFKTTMREETPVVGDHEVTGSDTPHGTV